MHYRAVALTLLAIVVGAGCGRDEAERPAEAPDTVARLERHLSKWEKEPTELRTAQVEADLAQLDVEIANLKVDVLRTEDADRRGALQRRLAELEAQRKTFRERWVKTQVGQVAEGAEEALRAVGESIARGPEEAGRRLQKALSEAERRPGADARRDVPAAE